MVSKHTNEFLIDEVGYWSEIKQDILVDFSAAYSKILSAQNKPKLHHIYIDAFAGSGVLLSKRTGELITGSPINVLEVKPPFKEYHFIDLDKKKVKQLKSLVGKRPDVFLYEGDCNEVLINDVLPRARFEDYRRGLCLLDPYGLQLDWQVVQTAGHMRSIDMFLNFPIMDMNRNVLLKNPDKITTGNAKRMNTFWGDESWRDVVFGFRNDLFGGHIAKLKGNEAILDAYCQRLRGTAGFRNVPKPLPMWNSRGSIVYYLIFASQKPVANEIITRIFQKYRLEQYREWRRTHL